MNSLGDLRKFFEDNQIEVKNFTGYSLQALGSTWGLAFQNPVRDGVEISAPAWKEYVKTL